jgi:predicted transcriptional regulator
MIQVQKDKDKVLLSITTQLDREDVKQLVDDLNVWLEDTLEMPKFKGVDEKAVREAWEYSQSKRKLEEGMKQYIASIKPTQHIHKELQTFELDPIGREVIIDKVKLKQNGR